MDEHEFPLGSRFREALDYAARIHARQKRKGSEVPYVSHLMSVAALVMEDGGTENEVIAALLHDAIEDQGGLDRRTEILDLFGEEVTSIVDGCTDSWEMPKPPWRERKESHIRTLREASREVLRVASADKLHNARSILSDLRRNGDATWALFRGGREGTLWYYRTLHELLTRSAPGSMVEELGRVLAQMESFATGSGS
jgi:(p)ppGpp synthase/HD superfamily hydrolase